MFYSKAFVVEHHANHRQKCFAPWAVGKQYFHSILSLHHIYIINHLLTIGILITSLLEGFLNSKESALINCGKGLLVS